MAEWPAAKLLALSLGMAAVSPLGCKSKPKHKQPPAATASVPPPAAPSFPMPTPGLDPANPTFADLAKGVSGEKLSHPEACGGCHQEIYAQWQTSAHHFSSLNNPVYRKALERFRAARSPKASRFCGGCHDIALIADKALDSQELPNDARAQAGVSCLVCHRIDKVHRRGNGSYHLAASDGRLPVMGNQISIGRHQRQVGGGLLQKPALCGTCHQSFLHQPKEQTLTGLTEMRDWEESAFGKTDLERVDEPNLDARCQDCHMPRVKAHWKDPAAKQGKIHSHRFLGGHTSLAAWRGDKETLHAIERFLKDAVELDARLLRAAKAKPSTIPGPHSWNGKTSLTLEVQLFNAAAGHRLMAGVRDAQDLWLHVTLLDKSAKVLGESGSPTADDKEHQKAHRFVSLMVDGEGKPVLGRQSHNFRTLAWDQTVMPRDVRITQFRFKPQRPVGANQWPLRLQVSLLHRTRLPGLMRDNCFSEKPAPQLAKCLPTPVTELANLRIKLTPKASELASASPA